jgi:hypothetical protein
MESSDGMDVGILFSENGLSFDWPSDPSLMPSLLAEQAPQPKGAVLLFDEPDGLNGLQSLWRCAFFYLHNELVEDGKVVQPKIDVNIGIGFAIIELVCTGIERKKVASPFFAVTVGSSCELHSGVFRRGFEQDPDFTIFFGLAFQVDEII